MAKTWLQVLCWKLGVQEAGRGAQTSALIHKLQTSCYFQSWSVGYHQGICAERRWVSKGETTDNGWQLSSVPMGQSSDPLSGMPKPPARIASHHIWLNGHAMRCTHIPYILKLRQPSLSIPVWMGDKWSGSFLSAYRNQRPMEAQKILPKEIHLKADGKNLLHMWVWVLFIFFFSSPLL